MEKLMTLRNIINTSFKKVTTHLPDYNIDQ